MKLERILVGTDFSECSADALDLAIRLGKHFESTVRVVHVLDDLHPVEAGYYGMNLALWSSAETLQQARTHLENWAKEHSTDDVKLETELLQGSIVDSLQHEANEWDANLTVLGTHGLNLIERALIGTVAEKATRGFDRPLLTVPHRLDRDVKSILVPIEVPGEDASVAKAAESLRLALGAKVEFLYVLMDPQNYPLVTSDYFPSVTSQELRDRAIEASRESLRKLIGANVELGDAHELRVVIGSPSREIVRRVEQGDIDLVFMGSHGRGGVARFLLGSVAERVIRSAPCAVWRIHRE